MRHLSAFWLVALPIATILSPALAAPPGLGYWVAPAGVFRPPPAPEPVPPAPQPPPPVRPVPPLVRVQHCFPVSPVVQEVLGHLRRDHFVGARLDPLHEFHSVEEVLEALGDPWTRYVPRSTYPGTPMPYDLEADRLDLDSGDLLDPDEEAATYGPLGISLGFRGGTEPVVMGLVATGPAWLAGLRPGDRIVAVHGVPTSIQSPSRLYYQLVHRPSALVTVEVEREGRRHVYELEAQLPLTPPVRVRLLAGGFAYARVPLFTTETAVDLDNQMRTLEQRGALHGLVLDLRGNPGGRLHLAVETAELFMGLGVLTRIQERGGTTPQYCVTRETPRTLMPLVVLVDEGTGGVAEIVAGGLQDNGRALIVGQCSSGKGTVYETTDLTDGSQLHLTTGYALTPAGRPIEGHGIQPDIAVSLAPMDERQLYSFRLSWEMWLPADLGTITNPLPADAQLRRAIDVLNRGAADVARMAARRRVPLPTDAELLAP